MRTKITRALLSVYDKTGVVEFARELDGRGVELVSSGGTAQAIADAGIPVTVVDDITGVPPILDHRVVTLHPKIHGGILADRSKRPHDDDMATYGIRPFDLVVSNLYPFRGVARHRNHRHRWPRDDARRGEEPRVGHHRHRPVAVRRRARGARRATTAPRRRNPPRLRDRSVRAAPPRYDAAIVAWLASATKHCRSSSYLALERTDEPLRYGENPHQAARALPHRGHDELVGHRRRSTPGSRSRTSTSTTPTPRGGWSHDLGDATGGRDHQARQPVRRRARRRSRGGLPAGARVRRALGVRRHRRPEPAGRRRHRGAHGRRPPGRSRDRARIGARHRRRVGGEAQEHPPARGGPAGRRRRSTSARSSGGFLVQDPHHFAATRDDWRVVTKRAPTDEEWRDAEFAWRICGHVKSNAIVLVKDGQAVGIGAGQQNRVESGEIAAKKAAGRAAGGACASDAFYPFPDGIEAAAAAGVAVVVQPGGSIATRRTSSGPTSRASRWCSPANDTSFTEEGDRCQRKMMPGGPVADAVFADLVPRSEKLIANGHTPGLGTILVGDDGASARYVGMKMEKAQELGWTSPHLHLPESTRRRPTCSRPSATFNDDPRRRRVPHPAPDAPAHRLRRRAAGDGSRQGRRRHAPGQHGPAGAR